MPLQTRQDYTGNRLCKRVGWGLSSDSPPTDGVRYTLLSTEHYFEPVRKENPKDQASDETSSARIQYIAL